MAPTINAIIQTLSDRVKEGTEQISNVGKKIILGVKSGLHEVATTNAFGLNLRTVANNFSNHFAGITACVTSAVRNPTTEVIMSEIVKIGSFLGMEIPIVNVLTSRAAALAENAINYETLEDCIPAIATMATIAGKEISDISIDTFINSQARNIKNIKVIQDQMRIVMETAGILEQKNHEKIVEILNLLVTLKEEYQYFVQTMAVAGHDLNKPLGKQRLLDFERNVKELNTLIKTVSNTSFKNNSVFVEANTLHNLALKILAQAKIVQSQKMRITPVGVCIQGPSGIGKSTLVTKLLNAVKKKLADDHIEELGDTTTWQTWFAQFRDDYDTGYIGQEITYMDDAFQKRDNTDHPMWINFISNQPIGMVMAREEEKGKPYNSYLCVTTCNVLPTQSVTISDINALHNRFPITIKASIKQGCRKPTSAQGYDDEFKHLNFQVGTMQNAIAKTGLTECTFDDIVNRIAMSVYNNYDKCNKIMSAAITQYQMDDVEEPLEEGLVLFDPSVLYNNGGCEFDNIILEEEEEVEEPELDGAPTENTVEKVLLGTPVVVYNEGASTSGTQVNQELPENTPQGKWTRYPHVKDPTTDELRKLRISKAVGEAILKAFATPHIEEVRQLGDWIWMLKRKSDGKFLKEVYSEYKDDKVADFIRALGIWEFPESKEFKSRLAKVPPLRVTDCFDSSYIWSPSILEGRYLLLDCEGLRLEVQSKMKPFYKKCIDVVKRTLVDLWAGQETRQAMLRYAVADVGIRVLPFPFVTGIFQQAAMYRLVYRAAPEIMDYWFVRYNPFMRAQYWMCEKINQSYQVVEHYLHFVKDATVSVVLKICELLGMEITPIINNLADIVGDVVLHATILSIFSMLLYLLYKLIMSFSKKEEIEQQNNNYDPDDNKKKKASRKGKRVVRKMKYQAADTLCKDCSSSHTVKILGEEFEFTHDKTKNNVYELGFMDVIEDYVEEGKSYVGAIYLKQDNCFLMSIYEALEQFRVEKDKIVDFRARHHPLLGNNKAACIKLQARGENIREHIHEMLKQYQVLGITETFIDFIIGYTEEEVHCELTIFGLQAIKDGQVNHITKRAIASCSKVADLFSGKKIHGDETVEEIVKQNMQEAVQMGKAIKENFQVEIVTAAPGLYDTENYVKRNFGFGHKSSLITNAHTVSVGEVVRWYQSPKRAVTLKDYYLAVVENVDFVRDVAILRIISFQEARTLTQEPLYRARNDVKVFGDLGKYLYTDTEWANTIDCTPVLVDFPKSDITVPAIAKVRELKSHRIQGTTVQHDYVEIGSFALGASFSAAGDCGGYIIANAERREAKLIGFHSAAGDTKWYGSVLTKDDLARIREETDKGDPWHALIVKGEPTDLPQGSDVQFMGKYGGTTTPVSNESLAHWHRSPWSDKFEEQLEPSPLSPRDKRVEGVLLKNQEGNPSFLMTQNSIMCQELPKMDGFILEVIEKAMVNELSCKMHGRLKPIPSDYEKLLPQALNGNSSNKFVTGLKVNKAAGIPWASLARGAKKSDYLNVNEITGEVTFNDQLGYVLKKRVLYKLEQAKEGKRVISLSNSKVKDALIKKSAVKSGKVRVFHSIPVDKIIVDSALFGNFKDQFQQLFVEAHHAIGVNPHSKGWGEIYHEITKHNNYFDCDFANYDKHLHKELMQTVFNIINKTIMKVAPDEWDLGRQVLAQESIETYVVDYDTVYKTERGNKSGEFLTTIVNCIANDILSFYAWIKVTGESSIETFRNNVSLISFGDDKIESVSDEYKDQYNYMTVKEELTRIGHIITPGSKDGMEQPFTELENLQFIKRSFKELRGQIVAPLLKRSLEAPLTWTTVPETDLLLWEGIIKEKLYEAYLWGEEYYEEVRKKLMYSNSPELNKHLAAIVSVEYQHVDYWTKCFKYE